MRYAPTPGTVYDRLVRQMQLPVKRWLVNQDGSARFTGQGRIPDLDEPGSGSAKVDAHRWAVKQYLRSGHCKPGMAAYYVDSFWLRNPGAGNPTLHTLSNHDYFIAHRAFFFDLSPWGDEVPQRRSETAAGP